ncbi:uncharacterized protein JCM6883_003909 [Sporobolomyces salmoneus]|uniref:uncharacterized protein n=1 Tax=Sporobolomyces salmoneus TaxID=183962 RepID=UPI00317AFC4D
MPSYIALAAVALASIHERLLTIPLLVLTGVFPPLSTLTQHVLLPPFSWAAKGIKLVGVALQVLYLLEGLVSEAVGEGLNSFASSSSSTSPAAQLSRTRLQLTNLTTTVYPSSLSTFYGKRFDPLFPTTDPNAPIQLTQKDVDDWEIEGIKLKQDVENGIRETVDLWIEILDNSPSDEYLLAAKEEINRIQAGRPTTYLYQGEVGTIGDELSRKIELADNEFQAEQAARLDKEFEIFLDQMGMDEKARSTLDNPSDPKDSKSKTFRQLLRSRWEEMNGPNGVMGNVQSELANIFGGGGGGDGDSAGLNLGMGAPLEPGVDIDQKFASPDYKPARIPLMTIHLLRDQINKAIAARSARPQTGLLKYLEPEDPTDSQILPKVSRKVSDDYLDFFQRAVKIDLRARDITLAIISYFSPSSAPSLPRSESTNASNSPSILLSSSSPDSSIAPFPAFVKKLDWTLTRSAERFLSKHEFARTAFGEATGWLAVRRLEDKVKQLEKLVEEEGATKTEKLEAEL